MATVEMVCHVAVCDVCGTRTDAEYHWDDPKTAIEYAAEEDDWTLTAGGQLVCGDSDSAHDEARGHESPVLLRPGPDAMTITYSVDEGVQQ